MEKTELPDLIIVDGGKLQIAAVLEVLDSLHLDICVIGLKKDDKHKTSKIVLTNYAEISPTNNNLFVYLYKMQEEVHRFAITFHRSTRQKTSLKSVLDEIEGIGPKRKQNLLKHFGSIKKMRESNEEEFMKIGLPQKVAHNLKVKLDSKE